MQLHPPAGTPLAHTNSRCAAEVVQQVHVPACPCPRPALPQDDSAAFARAVPQFGQSVEEIRALVQAARLLEAEMED